MSRLRDRGARHDVFFKKARDQGFAARAVFKLEDLDKKLNLLRAGERVLDLGCRPGSWLQYAALRVGPHGKLVGIDRLPMPADIPGARIVLADLYETPDDVLLGELAAFDVVLSDMAPDTTGIRSTDQARSAALVEEALGRAERLLAPGGAFVAKVFQGPDVEIIRKRMEKLFATVRLVKPEASRKISTELYLAGKGFAPAAAVDERR
ncbi:MAG: RlmE family RNA methyltransferase [Deltaproteobacteria bacterium]|nr:RlmE family RNA methyltransferase [Deltaproteobacteria bacterium]